VNVLASAAERQLTTQVEMFGGRALYLDVGVKKKGKKRKVLDRCELSSGRKQESRPSLLDAAVHRTWEQSEAVNRGLSECAGGLSMTWARHSCAFT
jgi:hypothetical protein